MITFDTRLLAAFAFIAIAVMIIARIRISDVRGLFWFSFVFMVMNNIMIYLFSPEHGVSIYGSRTEICHLFWRYYIVSEQLFYHLNVILKYMATIPVVIIFVSTTDPSEFASSLNRIGVSYRIAYSVSLALRYIPDIQRAYHDISIAQQARGLEMASRKQSILKRLKNATTMIFPLIISSMQRIEVIANAMELRGFGKGKKRTWYTARPFVAEDFICMGLCIVFLVASFLLNAVNGGRYFNPFV